MKISADLICSLNPCSDGLNWYLAQGSEDLEKTLLDVNNYNPPYARWLFTKLMNKEQNVAIAIFSAELVLNIYESKYPNNKATREAIQAAKAYLKMPSEENKQNAQNAADAAAAAYATSAAAYDASAAAADAAAATYAADAAAAAYAAAAYAADAAAYADMSIGSSQKIRKSIIQEAVRILDNNLHIVAK